MFTTRQIESVRAFISLHELLSKDDRVLVGLSGGVDSVVLTDILLGLGYAVSALHINFRLRGRASDGDEEFVRAWCKRKEVSLRIHGVDTLRVAEEREESVQQTARFLRYDALARIALEEEFPAAAVGHHRDDQAETVLINLFRGTGPEGLAGIPVSRRLHGHAAVRLIRPLLCLRRAEIESYALASDLEWRVDASNRTTTYRRGALRTCILPVISEYFGSSATENIARSADLVRAYVESGLERTIHEAFDRAVSEHADGHALDLHALRSMDEVTRGRVILEGIRRWLPGLGGTTSTTAEVERLLDADPGKRLLHPTGEVWRERNRLLFLSAKKLESDLGGAAILQPGILTETPLGAVSLQLDVDLPERLDSGFPNVEYVDADRLNVPIIVRRWQPGDRFIPLGMEHSKKISDFLTDDKVSPHLKSEVRVVQAGEEIVWVVGRRISASVRVRPDTRRVARLQLLQSATSN